MYIYDPKRDEFEGYDPVAELTEQRRQKAEKLREVRKRLRSKGWSVTESNDIARLASPRGDIMRPTVSNLRKWALSMWNFAEEPIPWHLSCGASDYYGERQDYARSHALAIWRAVGRY